MLTFVVHYFGWRGERLPHPAHALGRRDLLRPLPVVHEGAVRPQGKGRDEEVCGRTVGRVEGVKIITGSF